jgi:hypothetical protein
VSDLPTAGAPRRPASPKLVFISHSSKDEELVRWLVAHVEAVGHRAWVAEWDLQLGHSLTNKVADALNASDVYMILLTEDGYDSIYVAHETGAASMSGKPVIALVDQELAGRPLGMLNDIEQIRFDRSDLAASTASIVVGLTQLGRRCGVAVTAEAVAAPAQPALLTMSVDINAEFHLTADQVVLGVAALMLVAGLIYLASQD